MAYRALDRLLDTTPPLLKGRRPFWRPNPAPVTKDVREPMWNWSLPLVETEPVIAPDGTKVQCWSPAPPGNAALFSTDTVMTLDCNAAFLAAASTVEVAHGKLDRTKSIAFDPKRPGYWDIEIFPWQVPSIWSPLGTAQAPKRAWLTTPTVALLAQLVEAGYWPEIHVYDSWTASTKCRLRAWTDLISGHRREALIDGDTERYEEIKLGYSQAVTTMGLDKKSLCYRPDWSQHIRAQHAANMWRKAWKAASYGCPVLASGTVDEVAVTLQGLQIMEEERLKGHRTPIRLDQSGHSLGSFKVKDASRAWEWVHRSGH